VARVFSTAATAEWKRTARKKGQIGHQVLDHWQVWQRVDPHIPLHVVAEFGARQRICAIDIHGAGTADSLATRPPKGQRRIYLILDLDEGVENHRPARIRVEFIRIEARLPRGHRVISVNMESTHPGVVFHRATEYPGSNP
jgi:hypothetical protein